MMKCGRFLNRHCHPETFSSSPLANGLDGFQSLNLLTGATREYMSTPPTSTSVTTTPQPQSRIFHTLLVFRCPTQLSEALAALAARRGNQNISAVIRDLLREGLKSA
jgi:Ribbon-helix-helix protein, copG family